MGTNEPKSETPDVAARTAGHGDLDSILGFHIRLAHGAVYRHFTETFTDLGLTQKQVSVLWTVAEQPGLFQADLGQQLQMDRATTTEIINRLAARDLLRREPSPLDRRKSSLHLQPEGERVLEEARNSILSHETWLKERFTDAEVATLIGLLTRIHSLPPTD